MTKAKSKNRTQQEPPDVKAGEAAGSSGSKARAFEVNRSEARAILGGVAERTFARLESEGVLVAANRGRGGRASVYDLRQLVPAYLTYVQGLKPTDDREARSRRDRSQAELNELRLARERGELVPRQAVIIAGQAYTKAWSARVRGLARRLVQDGRITRGQETGVAETCLEFLTEIASWRTLDDGQGEETATP